MADAQERANTQPEVEIDLDDVKETNVQVEETIQEESKEPNFQKDHLKELKRNIGEVMSKTIY